MTKQHTLDHDRINQLIKRLQHLGSDRRIYPFPGEDCRTLIPDGGKYYHDLVTLLDLYSIDIVGYSKFARRICNLSPEKRKALEADLRDSFFDKHPEYKVLQERITENETPHLFEVLSLFEQMRLALLELVNLCEEASVMLRRS